MEIIALEIEIGGLKKVINNVGELEQAIRNTRDELKQSGKIGSESYLRVQRQLGKLKEVKKEVNAETRKQGREFQISADQGKRSYRALNAELVNLRANFKELSEADRKGAIGKGILKNIQALDTELKQIDASIGNFQRNVGNYRQALIGIGDIVTGGLLTGGITSLIQGFKQQVSEAITVTADFSRQIGLLGAITGTSGEQLQKLEDLALQFGGSTEFTSSQVAALQIEYAKLGFTAQEIEKILPSTIDAATLSGEDLGRTANVVGSAVRAFGLDASQSGELVDVLAASFSGSALDLSKFETAISNVGATSAVVGQPIEKTIAQLGILANNGIDASTASTSLRNIFIKLAASGQTLEGAFSQIRESQDPLTTAVELFDVRAANVAVTLANQTDKANELQASLFKVKTASDSYSAAAAGVVRNDLQGAIDSTKSAFEAFRITLVGLVEDDIKNLINGVANGIRLFTSWVSNLKSLDEIVQDVKSTFITWLPTIVALTTAIALNNSAAIIGAISALPQYIASMGRAIASSRLFTTVQTVLNAVMRANPIGIIITAIGLLTTGLIAAYKRSEQFRAVIDGLGAVAAEFFNIIKETFSSFIQGFRSISEGDITGGLQSIGTALVKGNPVSLAVTQGNRLGDAFKKGYQTSLDTSALEAEVGVEVDADNAGDDIQNQLAVDPVTLNVVADLPTLDKLESKLSDLKKQLKEAVIGSEEFNLIQKEIAKTELEIKEARGSSVSDSAKQVKEAIGPYKELSNVQSKLKDRIKDAITEGKPYADLLDEYSENTQRLNTINDEFKDKIDNLIVAGDMAEGSIDQLNSVVKDLRENLDKSDASGIQDNINELIEAENKLAAAQLEIDRARNIAQGGTGVLGVDIEDDLASIERHRQQQLIALEQTGIAEEQYAERKKQINLKADIDILEQRMQLYSAESVERLELEREILEKRKELNVEADENLFQSLQSRVQAAAEILTGTFDTLQQFSDARTEREVSNLERRYDREIELAEGNQEEIERLEMEKDSRIEAIQRQAFERQKKLQIATALVSAAQGVVNILAAPTTLPDPFGAVFKALRVGVLLASTAAQVASINARTFAFGGYTGRGTYVDETGHRVAGIVHEDEYVVPKRVLKTAEGAELVSRLERMRKRDKPASSAVYQHKRLFVTGGLAKVPQVQPLLPGAAGTNVTVTTTPKFDDQQINTFARAVAVASREGIREGTIEASNEVQLNNDRRKRLSNLTG
jgi:hypothetical protein